MVQYIHGGGRNMAVRPMTEARAAAIARYDEKTYKDVNIKLRLEEDADILGDIQEAKKAGLTLREWLRGLYEGQKK